MKLKPNKKPGQIRSRRPRHGEAYARGLSSRLLTVSIRGFHFMVLLVGVFLVLGAPFLGKAQTSSCQAPFLKKEPTHNLQAKVRSNPPDLAEILTLFNDRREKFFPETPLHIDRPDILKTYGLRYTRTIREQIFLMRMAAKIDPKVTSGTINRTAKYRAKWQKWPINEFIKENLGQPIEIVFTKSKIVYISRAPSKPWVVVEDPVNRYFRVVHRDEDRLPEDQLPPNHGRYRNIHLDYMDPRNFDHYQTLTHFNYAPYAKNEEAIFLHLGLFEKNGSNELSR